MRRARPWTAALAVALAAACAEEVPTDVGGPLHPGDAVRTFEVILEPAVFLDTTATFTGYGRVIDATFVVVARSFQDALDAHTLARFQIPTTIAAADSTGTVRSDTLPVIVGGRFVLQLDTLRSSTSRPLAFELHRIEQDWDVATASWTMRIDSPSVKQTWTRPGATGGRFVGSGVVEAGGDTLVIPVDTATLRAWADTTTAARGAVLSLLSQGVRVKASDVVLRVDARPSFRPDTVVTVTVRPPDRTFVFQPAPAPGSALLVGGLPGWRSYYRFRDRIDTLTVSCAALAPGCRIRLRDANVTYASMLLAPVTAPAGFVPEDSMRLTARVVIATPQFPLGRSPLGGGVGIARNVVGPGRFLPPAGGSPIELGITEFLRPLAVDTASDPTLSRYVGIVPLVEAVDFGTAAFSPGPRLRLVLTLARELQLR